jgi:Asp-tRNA(Asn)/Glu-tRNA(Gln) amidotransferase A subunit family amidase
MLSALSLARAIEAGELTPGQAVERCAQAIAAGESEVGAFVTIDIDGARKAAEQPGLKHKPLRGIPVALKDIFDTADMPTEYGSPIYAGYRPKMDGSVVAMIRRAGGTLIGKTVTTEFAHLDPGKTRNPKNLAHTPGGSSSGSAAGVAAGFFPIATGSQTGGSVIRPASFCGVAGFKPSYRLLPAVGMKCMSWHLDTAGLFAASVADVAFAAAAISDRELRVDGRKPASPRIGVLREPPWLPASDDMIAALDNTARAASAANARVRDIELTPVLAAAFRAHATIQAYEAARSLASEFERARDKLAKGVLELVESGLAISADTYDDARRTASQARRSLADLMTDIDVILSPSAPGAAPKGLTSTGSSTFNRLWTLMGTPCVSVPGHVDLAGLPLGMQVIGKFGSDRATLEAALFIESVLPSNELAGGLDSRLQVAGA